MINFIGFLLLTFCTQSELVYSMKKPSQILPKNHQLLIDKARDIIRRYDQDQSLSTQIKKHLHRPFNAIDAVMRDPHKFSKTIDHIFQRHELSSDEATTPEELFTSTKLLRENVTGAVCLSDNLDFINWINFDDPIYYIFQEDPDDPLTANIVIRLKRKDNSFGTICSKKTTDHVRSGLCGDFKLIIAFYFIQNTPNWRIKSLYPLAIDDPKTINYSFFTDLIQNEKYADAFTSLEALNIDDIQKPKTENQQQLRKHPNIRNFLIKTAQTGHLKAMMFLWNVIGFKADMFAGALFAFWPSEKNIETIIEMLAESPQFDIQFRSFIGHAVCADHDYIVKQFPRKIHKLTITTDFMFNGVSLLVHASAHNSIKTLPVIIEQNKQRYTKKILLDAFSTAINQGHIELAKLLIQLCDIKPTWILYQGSSVIDVVKEKELHELEEMFAKDIKRI